MTDRPDGAAPPRVLIRAPNHLGELVLALPALARAAERWPGRASVQVVEGLAPLLGMADLDVDVLPLRGRHRLLRAARRLRRRGFDRAVLLTPSFSAALLVRLAGIPERRGTDTDFRGWLLTDPVDRAPLLEGHRVAEYLALVDPGWRRDSLPRPRLEAPPPRRTGTGEAGEAPSRGDGGTGATGGPVVGLAPGGNASSRRWPVERWRELAARLADAGGRVRVFGGPDERPLTARVAGGRARVEDLGGRTDLPGLAAGLASCRVVVANDSGPMHVAAALDRPLVAVWGAGDPRQTRPLSSRTRLLGGFDLPCHPCRRNECPRTGEGYRLPEAERECLRLVTVDEVEGAVHAMLEDVEVTGTDGA